MKTTDPSESSPKRATSEMSFFDHLDELRGVLFACFAVVIVFSLGAWFISQWVLDFLVNFTVGDAQFIKPHEAFLTRFKLSLMIGFLVGLPFVAYKIWSFVVPGLLKREKVIVYPLMFWSTVLFLAGVAFSVLVLTPVMLKFLASFETDTVQSNMAVGYLFDFYIKISFACGLLFQLPLVIGVLSFFGLVTPKLLRSIWRHAIIGILILAAVVTPADILSQLMLGVPIIFLYFISILVSAMIQKSKKKEERQYETDSDSTSGDDDENSVDHTEDDSLSDENSNQTGGDSDVDNADNAGDSEDDKSGDSSSSADGIDSSTSTESSEQPGYAEAEYGADENSTDENQGNTETPPGDETRGAQQGAETETDSTVAERSDKEKSPLTPPPDDWCI